MKSIFLAGDIGGTKTTLAVVDAEHGPRAFIEKVTFPSSAYPSLEALVAEFLKGKNWSLTRATFGVAGPVVEGSVQATNLPWFIEEAALSQEMGVPVKLINDLSAIACAVTSLERGDLETLRVGEPVLHGPLAVIAPGTGLGEAYLHWIGSNYQPFPSEGGHTDFAPVGSLQIGLLSYLEEHLGHISYERVCSGIGLPNLYAFLKDSAIYPEPDWLGEQIAGTTDPSPVISRAALQNKADIAVAALDLFVTILGSEAGNLALKVLSTGGVYLGGGIPPRILPFLKKDNFLNAFQEKGRFSEMLAKMPVHVILNPEAALIGAACHGLEQVRIDA
jgi:glucokinase